MTGPYTFLVSIDPYLAATTQIHFILSLNPLDTKPFPKVKAPFKLSIKGASIMKSLFTAVILLLVSSTIALAQCSESDKQALEKFDHGWTDANARGDRAFLETV